MIDGVGVEGYTVEKKKVTCVGGSVLGTVGDMELDERRGEHAGPML